MDPNLFRLDFGVVSEVLLSIIVLSLMIERALAVLFENRWFMERFVYTVVRAKDRPGEDKMGSLAPETIVDVQPRFRGLKELITLGVCLAVCLYWKFDGFSILMPVPHTEVTLFGELLTAMIIAGGSKGAIKLFSDWLDIKSSAQREIDLFRSGARPKAKKVKS